MPVRRGQRGSALMLVPAGVLVLVALGAMALDSAIAYLGQRQLSSLAAAAANDVAGAALSDAAFYGTAAEPGTVVLDQAAAEQEVDAALHRHPPAGVELDGPALVRTSGDRVCVELTGRVDAIFARAVPGFPHARTVRGRAVATAVRAAADGAPVPVPPAGTGC